MAWDQQVRGSQMFQVLGKLKNCKYKLLHWRKSQVLNPFEKVNLLNDKLRVIQGMKATEENLQLERNIIKEIDDIQTRDNLFWYQRSRIRWLSEGDRNTKFFHASASQRRQRNHIARLKVEGNWVEGDDNLKEAAVNFFSSLFSKSANCNFARCLNPVPKCITDSMNMSLCSLLSDEEILNAVKQLGAFKAPGSDGFPGNFFQAQWHLIGADVCKAVKRFFDGNFLLKEFNQTYIALIPKVEAPSEFSQFRPISLCNFIYKIGAKCMANRLKPIMSSIISPNQSAFVPGRQIQDNIIVAHEAFHYLNHRRKGARIDMAFKIDLNKAYDRVEWAYPVRSGLR